MKSLVTLLKLEARKTTAEASSEGLAIWEDSQDFSLLDFNRAILKLSRAPDNMLKQTFQMSRTENLIDVDGEALGSFLMRLGLVVGQMSFMKRSKYYGVATVAAEKGYGPMMYYILAKKSKTGYIASDDQVRPEAQGVWQRFYDDKKVQRELRPEVENEDDNGFFYGRKMPVALKYMYRPVDSKTNLGALKRELEIGLTDLQEQIAERLTDLYPSAKPEDVTDYVMGRLPFNVGIGQASDQFFAAIYHKDPDAPPLDPSKHSLKQTHNALPKSAWDTSTKYTGTLEFDPISNFHYPQKATFVEGKLDGGSEPALVALIAPGVEERVWYSSGMLKKSELFNLTKKERIITTTYWRGCTEHPSSSSSRPMMITHYKNNKISSFEHFRKDGSKLEVPSTVPPDAA